MRKLGVFVMSLAFLFMIQAAVAQSPGPEAIMGLTPDVANGAALAAEGCAGCHFPDGNSVQPWNPRLAGQIRSYEVAQLWAFRAGERQSAIMNPLAAGLSDQDIADVTAYFSSQTPAGAPWGRQDPALIEQGAALYALGNHEAGVIACAVCHGANGEGVDQLAIPRIFGQGPNYVKDVLAAYATASDTGVAGVSAMTLVVSRLSEAEIEALLAFVTSQPWGNP